MKLDGKIISDSLVAHLKTLPKPSRFLAGVLAGENDASKSFLARKKKIAEEIGLDFRLYEFPENISADELRKKVGRIANAKTCGGVIIQLPLPGQINAQYVLNAIPAEKDVDVLGERSLGAFYAGRNRALPPSVATLEEILRKMPLDLKDSIFTVVGAGRLIGKPVSAWLLGKVKELIVLDLGSDISEASRADVIICGAGASGIVKPELLKNGAMVIDFGYAKNSAGKISGDLDISDEEALSKLGLYTPTPGGTGPILVAKIIENFFKLNER